MRGCGKYERSKLEKFGSKLEGPYWVTTMAGAGAYYLEDMEERPLPRPSNVSNLRRYYH